MARVADYEVLKDKEIDPPLTTGAEIKFDWNPPADVAVDKFFCEPILMFLVRADALSGERLKLRAELNGNVEFEREIVADTAARSYHEVINRENVNPGARNVFRFAYVGSNKAGIIISDVVVWFQRSADS